MIRIVASADADGDSAASPTSQLPAHRTNIAHKSAPTRPIRFSSSHLLSNGYSTSRLGADAPTLDPGQLPVVRQRRNT